MFEHLQENPQAAEGALDEDTLKACDGVWSELRGARFRYNTEWRRTCFDPCWLNARQRAIPSA
jgi:hypothetical protein